MLWVVYHHDKGHAGSGLLRTNLENGESIYRGRLRFEAISLGTYQHWMQEGSAFHLCDFGRFESIQRYFRRTLGIRVLRVVICVLLGIIMIRDTLAAVWSERTWRMMKSIPSRRRLATDSARGTPRRNGTKRICEDVICISIPGGIDSHLRHRVCSGARLRR